MIEITLAATSATLALCTIFHVINMFIIYSVVLVAARTDCVGQFGYAKHAIGPAATSAVHGIMYDDAGLAEVVHENQGESDAPIPDTIQRVHRILNAS